MPNIYIKQQCFSIIKMIEVFEQACVQSAKRDDGKISKDETATIKAIRKANSAYIKHISKISK